jgi:hypothetical protein
MFTELNDTSVNPEMNSMAQSLLRLLFPIFVHTGNLESNSEPY